MRLCVIDHGSLSELGSDILAFAFWADLTFVENSIENCCGFIAYSHGVSG
jgi:hypothetical protein